MDSNVGLAIQGVGIFLLTSVAILTRSWIKNASWKYWVIVWSAFSFALWSLFVVFHNFLQTPILYSAYFLGEYIFGVVFVSVCRKEVEHANGKLLQAREKLELLAEMDPLTEALNRHAFHSLLRRPEAGDETMTSGSIAVLDIDNLKTINDTLGHSAGDKAIRAVARAVRSLIRADDMLFRWGGDEFLVLMFKVPEAEAIRRMEKLNRILDGNCAGWTGMPVKVSVSHGVAGFRSMTDLGQAIEIADKAMYAQRNQARGLLQNAYLNA